MGIRNFGRFLSTKCSTISRPVKLSSFSGKCIVIDASIYMYKFAGNNSLLADMYLFISILRESGVRPIFVFDGKPTDEKYAIIKKRGELKRIALEKYNAMRLDATVSAYELSQVRKQCVYLSHVVIQKVKDLLTAFGVTYYEAAHEADPLCAYLVQTGKAWACMSDDMDMFAYGCPRILRNTHLMSGTTSLFEMDHILESLNITLTEFRQLALLYGNDHCIDIDLPWDSMESAWSTFRCMKNQVQDVTIYQTSVVVNAIRLHLTYYNWLHHTGKISTTSFARLYSVYAIFCTESPKFQNDIMNEYTNDCPWLIDVVKPIQREKIQEIMHEVGFVFI